MNILIANVGNIRRNEIKVLVETLNKKHNVTVASMATDSSYRGLSFTFQDTPIRANPVLYKEVIKNQENKKTNLPKYDGAMAYEFYSNPADAISIMLSEIMITKRPDIVICGLSNGIHMGQDIYCSSNIGMAMESVFFRVPSIAVAVERQVGGHSEESLMPAAKFIDKNIEKFAKMNLSGNTFLNINIPSVKVKGVKVTSMGRMNSLSTFQQQTDHKGDPYYWANFVDRVNASENDQSESAWFEKGYITITPLSYDATDYEAMRHWDKKVLEKVRNESEDGQ